MNIEISPAKSGKTTRLIEAAKKWVAGGPDNKAMFVMEDGNPNVVLNNFERSDFPRVFIADRMIDLPQDLIDANTRFFVDDVEKIPVEKLEILKDAFYTASDSENEFVVELVRANKGKFKSFVGKEISQI